MLLDGADAIRKKFGARWTEMVVCFDIRVNLGPVMDMIEEFWCRIVLPAAFAALERVLADDLITY